MMTNVNTDFVFYISVFVILVTLFVQAIASHSAVKWIARILCFYAAFAIVIIALDNHGILDYINSSYYSKHVDDIDSQSSYDAGYEDGYSDGLFVAEKEYEANKEGRIAGLHVVWHETPQSSCFAYIGHDSIHDKLTVVFRDSGAGYIYSDFTDADMEEFENSSSLGSYYNSNIKGKYPSEKIDDIVYFMRRGTFK